MLHGRPGPGRCSSQWLTMQAPHLFLCSPAIPSPSVFIAIAVFVVDGAYIICKLAILSWLSFKSRRAAAAKAEAEAEELERRASNGPLPGTVPAPREGKEGAKGTDLEDDDDDAGEHRLLGGETEHERALRRRVFLSGAIPWCDLGPAAAACCCCCCCCCKPHCGMEAAAVVAHSCWFADLRA